MDSKQSRAQTLDSWDQEAALQKINIERFKKGKEGKFNHIEAKRTGVIFASFCAASLLVMCPPGCLAWLQTAHTTQFEIYLPSLRISY